MPHKGGPPVIPLSKRFWEKVIPEAISGCFLWHGACLPKGYGSIRRGYKQKHVLAHRLAWELCRGPVPENMLVLHKCDNKFCVNPDHLYLGDYVQNMADAFGRGRIQRAKGEKHHMAKLTEAAVAEIRNTTISGVVLAERYGVCPSTISKVRKGKKWR